MVTGFVRAALATLVLAVLAAPATAQDEPPPPDIGLGIGFRSQPFFTPSQLLQRTAAPVAYFHSLVPGGFMIEPAIGYTRMRFEETTNRGRTVRTDVTAVQFGMGVLRMTGSTADGHAYYGLRAGVTWVAEDRSDVPGRTGDFDFTSAFVIGAEYFVASGLGIGGELFAERSWRVDSEPVEYDQLTLLQVGAELRFRWYFRRAPKAGSG